MIFFRVPGAGDALGQTVDKKRPVGDPGQRIVVGQVIEPLFHAPLLGDVPPRGNEMGNGAAGVLQRA